MNDIKNNRPDISVAMMTYFHEDYVAQAIESVLNQKTTYTYEIVISDDCSQDGTRDILMDYQKKYPEIIRLLFNETNLGITANNYRTRLNCKGRYIATLSGDDYWISDRKLQQQVDFLEKNLEYDACVTAVEGRYDNETTAFQIQPEEKYRGIPITLKMYLSGVPVCTHGLLMRNFYLSQDGRDYFSLVQKASKYIDDATECLLLLRKAPIYSMDSISVAYRNQRDKKGKHNYNSMNTALKNTMRMIELYKNLYQEWNGEVDLFSPCQREVAVGIAASIQQRNFREMKKVYYMIPAEYIERRIIIKSIPMSIKFAMKAVVRKIKK